MPTQVKSIYLSLIGLLISGAVAAQGRADDEFDIRREAFYLPASFKTGTFKHMIGLDNFFLPSDWTNVSLNAPMLNYSARLSLPLHFSLEGTLRTLYVANKFSLGLNYNRRIGNHFFAGAGYIASYNLGILHDDYQFATTVTAMTYSPSLAVGYASKETALTLRGGLEHLADVYFKTGSNVVKNHYAYINGAYLRVTMEQRLWKKHMLSLGVEVDRMKFVIVAWPAYPVNSKRYTIPQVTLGLTL